MTATATSRSTSLSLASSAASTTIALVTPGRRRRLRHPRLDTFTKVSESGDPVADNIDLTAAVTASDLWSLNAEATKVDFGSVARDKSVTKPLGKVTVVDDRNVLKGWDLSLPRGAPSRTVRATRSPRPLSRWRRRRSPVTPPSPCDRGHGLEDRLEHGRFDAHHGCALLFDADLTFTAPKDAQTGDYTSTLTVTLTSK